MKKMFYLCVAVCLMLCGSACDGTKKFQNVVNVHDKIQVFDPEEVMCSKVATLSVMGDYLIIRDSGDQGKGQRSRNSDLRLSHQPLNLI